MVLEQIAGLGKPIVKLFEVIEKGVGSVSAPYLIRRNADAKAYEIEKLAEAEAKSFEIKAESLLKIRERLGHAEYKSDQLALLTPSDIDVLGLTLPDRAKSRGQHLDGIEQQSTENITAFATEQTLQEDAVSDEPVDEDWIKRFFSYAKDVSTEEMQMLWGKILAGEVKHPGTFSLRALSVFRNMSQSEAKLFANMANFAIIPNGKRACVYYLPTFLANHFNVELSDFMALEDVGLIIPKSHMQYDLIPEGTPPRIYYHGRSWMLYSEHLHKNQISFPTRIFTRAGAELLQLTNIQPPLSYIYKFAEHLMNNGATVKYTTGQYGVPIPWDKFHEITRDDIKSMLVN